MSQNNTNKAFSGKLILDIGEWFYITSAPFYSIGDNKHIIWKSINPSIAQINPNSGLIYAKSVGETSIIGMSEDDNIRVLCAIQVQQTKARVITTVIDTPSTTSAYECCGNCSNDVSAIGYSGTVFSYTELGSRVTLEKGFGAKNGTKNALSYSFRNTLIQMNNIYASMSSMERQVWLVLRLKGLLDPIKNLLKGNYKELAKDYIKDIIVGVVLNSEELEAILTGLSSWYTAEEYAIAYYEAF